MTASADTLESVLESFIPSPALHAADLEGSFWRLFDIEGNLLSPFMVLAPGGLVGNVRSASVDLWQVVNGQLCLFAANATPSLICKIARTQDGRLVTLAGEGVMDGKRTVYMMQRTEHPEHPLYATPPAQERRAHFLKSLPDGQRRPNLVVVPAGRDSLHPAWLEMTEEAGRNWDLCIGYYGAETPDIATPHEYLAHLPATRKFRLLYDLFHEGSPLWDYEAIWLPDDDLLIRGDRINVMFHLFRKLGLDLSQPSMMKGPGCFPNHPLTEQREQAAFRYTQFVEIMCPIFSRRALQICLGTMRDTASGYGLDHLWPSLLGYPRGRIGIIDAVAAAHTRPIGNTYDINTAIGEQNAIHRAYRHQMMAIEGVR